MGKERVASASYCPTPARSRRPQAVGTALTQVVVATSSPEAEAARPGYLGTPRWSPLASSRSIGSQHAVTWSPVACSPPGPSVRWRDSGETTSAVVSAMPFRGVVPPLPVSGGDRCMGKPLASESSKGRDIERDEAQEGDCLVEEVHQREQGQPGHELPGQERPGQEPCVLSWALEPKMHPMVQESEKQC